MTRAVSTLPLGPEFNDFLFASLGEDRNGMRLSVVSALARLDVDPWQEAAALAGLPRASATRRLVSLIDLLPSELPVHQHPDTLAARLVALLPFRSQFQGLSPQKQDGGRKVTNYLIAIYLIINVLMMGMEWIATGHQSSEQHVDAPSSSSEQNSIKPAAVR